ncbi:MAG: helix-turn-helix domain-containing protein [Gemmatimonadota bacterium]|nr:helix-turn-helix domain-containing protein [Gemmatimonadota bacterium]
MAAGGFNKRFLETTRGQIVALLRRGARTVEELAQSLGLSDNAVRAHLAPLERDGLVKQVGVRRGAGAGKPATLYELHPEAEPLFSRAYAPVLRAMLEVIAERMPEEDAEALMRDVGRRLATQLGRDVTGDLHARVHAAAALLGALGGEAYVEKGDDRLQLRGYGCPLSAAVTPRGEVCRAVEALLSGVIGSEVREHCDRGDRPQCCFHVESAA